MLQIKYFVSDNNVLTEMDFAWGRGEVRGGAKDTPASEVMATDFFFSC